MHYFPKAATHVAFPDNVWGRVPTSCVICAICNIVSSPFSLQGCRTHWIRNFHPLQKTRATAQRELSVHSYSDERLRASLHLHKDNSRACTNNRWKNLRGRSMGDRASLPSDPAMKSVQVTSVRTGGVWLPWVLPPLRQWNQTCRVCGTPTVGVLFAGGCHLHHRFVIERVPPNWVLARGPVIALLPILTGWGCSLCLGRSPACHSSPAHWWWGVLCLGPCFCSSSLGWAISPKAPWQISPWPCFLLLHWCSRDSIQVLLYLLVDAGIVRGTDRKDLPWTRRDPV
jgi:hypothetical protein